MSLPRLVDNFSFVDRQLRCNAGAEAPKDRTKPCRPRHPSQCDHPQQLLVCAKRPPDTGVGRLLPPLLPATDLPCFSGTQGLSHFRLQGECILNLNSPSVIPYCGSGYVFVQLHTSEQLSTSAQYTGLPVVLCQKLMPSTHNYSAVPPTGLQKSAKYSR